MTEGDQQLDNFSDDEDFHATVGVSSRRRKTSLASSAKVVPDDGGIMRAYRQIPDDTYKMLILDDDVPMFRDVLERGRAYPVFLGLLSLAAAKDCRILDPSDLDHPRSVLLIFYTI